MNPNTWIMNSFIPGLVVDHYKIRIVALSTGVFNPLVNIDSEFNWNRSHARQLEEYAQSCWGRALFHIGI